MYKCKQGLLNPYDVAEQQRILAEWEAKLRQQVEEIGCTIISIEIQDFGFIPEHWEHTLQGITKFIPDGIGYRVLAKGE